LLPAYITKATSCCFTFSALTLLIGLQDGIWPVSICFKAVGQVS